jgi:hypothetical protein
MDDSGPSSLDAGHWEDELDACSDSDKSWGDKTDAGRESIASSLDSDDPVFSHLDVLELELELMQMYVRLSEWKQQRGAIRTVPIPQRTRCGFIGF